MPKFLKKVHFLKKFALEILHGFTGRQIFFAQKVAFNVCMIRYKFKKNRSIRFHFNFWLAGGLKNVVPVMHRRAQRKPISWKILGSIPFKWGVSCYLTSIKHVIFFSFEKRLILQYKSWDLAKFQPWSRTTFWDFSQTIKYFQTWLKTSVRKHSYEGFETEW